MWYIKVDTTKAIKALSDFAKQLEEASRAALHDALLAAEASAENSIRSQTVTRTGRLLAGVQTVQTGPYTGHLFSTAPYSGFIDGGTRPHIITAKGGGVLSFEIGGKRIFARSVKHPGTSPRPFVKPAMEAGLLVLEASLRARMATLR